MGLMQSNGGVHIAVATAKVSSWMGLMQTNGGVHIGSDTVAIAATQCERCIISDTTSLEPWSSVFICGY